MAYVQYDDLRQGDIVTVYLIDGGQRKGKYLSVEKIDHKYWLRLRMYGLGIVDLQTKAIDRVERRNGG